MKAPRFARQVKVRFVFFPAQEITETHLHLTILWLRAFCEGAGRDGVRLPEAVPEAAAGK